MTHRSIVPDKYQNRDPRNLVYHYPSIPAVKLSKILAEYYYYRALECAEITALKCGYLLVPYSCINWRRRKELSGGRKVKVLGKSFWMLKDHELTRVERVKLDEYYSELDEMV